MTSVKELFQIGICILLITLLHKIFERFILHAKLSVLWKFRGIQFRVFSV